MPPFRKSRIRSVIGHSGQRSERPIMPTTVGEGGRTLVVFARPVTAVLTPLLRTTEVSAKAAAAVERSLRANQTGQ